MRMLKLWAGLWALLGVLSAPMALRAAELPANFSLGRFVPADTWLYIHAAENPDAAWIEKKWCEVWDALASSGIDADITKLIYSALSEEDRATTQAAVEKWTELGRRVNWGDLLRKEMVFAERLSSTKIGFDYIFIAQGAEKSGEGNYAGLAALLKEIGTTIGFPAVDSKLYDADVCSLRLENKDLERLGFSVELFRKGDVVGLITSKRSAEDILSMMSGKSDKKSIASDSRFQEALGSVPAPRDAVIYVDARGFFGAFHEMMKIALRSKGEPAVDKNGKTPEKPEKDENAKKEAEIAAAILDKIIARLDVAEFAMTTVATKDRRQHSHSAIRFQAGKTTTPLISALLDRKPFEKYDQFVPVDATNFALTGAVDFEKLYKTVLDFVAKDVPGGEKHIANWNELLAMVGFDPQRDIFDWLGGEMISVSLPAVTPSPMGGGDSVFMIRTKKPDVAMQKIDALIGFANAKMQGQGKGQGQGLMVSPAKVNAEGFKEITHPMLMMMMRPVVGVTGEWLVIGSSAGAVNKCLDVASGKAPSIAKNPRFAEEGLIPKGPVSSISFADTTNQGKDLAAAVGMIGMFGGMAMSGMPSNTPEEKQTKQILQSAMGILMKLGPVLQKIDFTSSQASLTTYDGKSTVLTQAVVTYKSPGGETKTVNAGESPKSPPPPAKAPEAPKSPEPPKPPKK